MPVPRLQLHRVHECAPRPALGRRWPDEPGQLGHLVWSAPSCRARVGVVALGQRRRRADLHQPTRALDAVGTVADVATVVRGQIGAAGPQWTDASLNSRCVVEGWLDPASRSGVRGGRCRGSAPSSRWGSRRRSCGARTRGRSAGDRARARIRGTPWWVCRNRCSALSRKGARVDGGRSVVGAQMAAVSAPIGMRRSSSIRRSSSGERPSVVR
jgi:hypothetical protein